jgi:flagellar hook-length control protein FliK
MSVTIVSTLPNATPATAADSIAGNDNSVAGPDFASVLSGQLAPIVAEAFPSAVARTTLPDSEPAATDDASLLAGLAIVPGEAAGFKVATLVSATTLPEAFKRALPEIATSTTTETNIPSDAVPSDAVPSDAVPSDAVPSDAVPSDAVPSDAVPSDAVSSLPTLLIASQAPELNEVASLSDAGKIDRATSHSSLAVQTPLAVGADLKPEGQTEALRIEPETSQAPVADNKPAKFAVDPLAAAHAEQVISSKTSADAIPNTVTALTGNPLGVTGNPPAHGPASLSIPTPIRDQAWAGDFSQKIMWLTTNDKHTAQLSLTPPQMGPIEVSVNLDKGNAMVSFVSANADTRQAIESALPRLREMFATAGIELGQANVSAQSSGQQTGGWERGRSSSSGMADRAILVADSAGAPPGRAFYVSQGSGMIDIFA